MKPLAPILGLVDPALRHTGALYAARNLAMRTGAPLHLCLFDHDPLVERSADLVDPGLMHLARAQFARERQPWLATQTRGLLEEGLDASSEFAWSPDPCETLIARCLQMQPALVVSDPPDGCAAGLRMLRLCPAPLLLVRAQPASPGSAAVLACVDTSRSSETRARLNHDIVQQAAGLALATGSDLHLAHVVPFVRGMGTQNVGRRRLLDVVREEDERAFLSFAARHQLPEERCHLCEGPPELELARVVRQVDAGIAVVGVCARQGTRHLELGDTTLRLLRAPPCDLLLLKPADFVRDLARTLDLEAVQVRCGPQPRPGAADDRIAA